MEQPPKEPTSGTSGETPAVRGELKKVMTLVSLTPREDGSKPVFRLHKDRLVVGSVVSADVRLTGEGVSPIHAVIELGDFGKGGAAATIFDLASDTGTFVNGLRAVSQPLNTGDKVRCGKYELQFNVDDLEQISLKEKTRESGGQRLFLDSQEDFSPLLLEDERNIIQIFDYRPAQKRALEVVMSWRGTILDVEHFVTESQVTIGTSRKNDFGIPPLLAEAKYPMVTRSGADYSLNVDPKMRGVIQRRGKLSSLDELRTVSGKSVVPLGDEDFAKITLGEIDFYLSYTTAPPRLKMSRIFDRDPLFLQVLVSSAVLSAAIVLALVSTYKPKPIEAEEIPERLATILYQPERFVKHEVIKADAETHEKVPAKQPTPPKQPTPQKTVKVELTPHEVKKPVPNQFNATGEQKPTPAKAPSKATKTGSKHQQSQAKEGEGARAKGAEGTRGAKKATAGNEHQTAALRTSANGGKGAGGGESQVEDVGNVDILKAATGKIEDILGNTAARLGKGGEKLKGFGGFTTQGSGGLAIANNGAGGGGDAETTLGGLGKKGTGGGLVGTGKGAAGSGNGIIGGKARVALRTGGQEETVVMGSIDSDAVLAALLAHKDEFRLCYEKEINAETPNLAGSVGTTFVIGSTGRVTQAGIESTSLKSPNVERCILNVIKRIDFPIPRGAGVVQVTYPFKFRPLGNG